MLGSVAGDRFTLTHNVSVSDGGINSGHGGGDYEIMKSFINATANNDKKMLLTGPEETLESHLMVFAAEKSRENGTVENI